MQRAADSVAGRAGDRGPRRGLAVPTPQRQPGHGRGLHLIGADAVILGVLDGYGRQQLGETLR